MSHTLNVITIDIDPIIVRVGGLAVHWYGVMYVVGIVLGLRVAVPYAERHGISQDQAYRLFWPVLIACLVGGRLYYVLQSNAGWYARHPQNIIATWEGGMAFYGAVFLGVPVAYIACTRYKLSFPVVLDAAALFTPLAQTWGRVGNIINGDILGYVSSLPWATRYTNPSNTFVPSHTLAYQPAAAYELLFSAALFALIRLLSRKRHVPGELFPVWLVLYSFGQFFLFFLRSNPVVWLGLRHAQVTAIVTIALTVPLWWYWRRRQQTLSRPDPHADQPAVGHPGHAL